MNSEKSVLDGYKLRISSVCSTNHLLEERKNTKSSIRYCTRDLYFKANWNNCNYLLETAAEQSNKTKILKNLIILIYIILLYYIIDDRIKFSCLLLLIDIIIIILLI